LTVGDQLHWKNDRRALIAVMVVYMAATWWYIIPFGVVWDDWVLLAHTSQSFLSVGREAGRFDQALLILPFQSGGRPWTWALTAWVCLGGSVLFIFLAARRIRGVSLGEAFWIAALTATVPLYQARFVLSVLPYAISAAAFAASLFLLSTHLHRPHVARRIGALVLLLIACTTGSFLTLCWMFPALIAWHVFAGAGDRKETKTRIARAIRAVLSYPEFLVLPAIVFLLRRAVFPAYGLYANYYQLKVGPFAAIVDSIVVLWEQVRTLRILVPNGMSLAEAALPAGFLVIVGWLVARYVNSKAAADAREQSLPPPVWLRRTLLALALLTPILALYPYITVRQPPRFSGLWETRHQLTLMLVSGGVIVFIVRSFASRSALNVIATIAMLVFLTLDYSVARQFLVDRLEQREILRKFAAEPLPPGALVLVVESDRDFRMLDRFFAFYELAHMVGVIDGRADRLVVSNREILDPQTGTYATHVTAPVVENMLKLCSVRTRPEFGLSKYFFDGSVVQASITSQGKPVSFAKAIELSLSGEPTHWVKIERTDLRVNTTTCGPQ
jgi:hypothetical protein